MYHQQSADFIMSLIIVVSSPLSGLYSTISIPRILPLFFNISNTLCNFSSVIPFGTGVFVQLNSIGSSRTTNCSKRKIKDIYWFNLRRASSARLWEKMWKFREGDERT